MELNFVKYHGAGNDFILLDGRAPLPPLTPELVAALCHRRFGVGADGLMVLGEPVRSGCDFEMLFYNSDGHPGSMCGNGARCIVRFAEDLGVGGQTKKFTKGEELYTATVQGQTILLEMPDVSGVQKIDEGYLVDTGSPHVVLLSDFEHETALHLREKYNANVNFISVEQTNINITTYERGVEAVTWACGTGSVAVAIVTAMLQGRNSGVVYDIETMGGQLTVSLTPENQNDYINIVLGGPAQRVYNGKVKL